MRGVLVAALAAFGLLWGALASAQGIGDAAAREKQKRKAAPSTSTKVYTKDDLPPSVAAPSTPTDLPATVDQTSEAAEGEGEGGGDESATTAEEEAAAEKAWRRKLDQARQEEGVYRDVIDKLQLELNDMSGGVYNPGRAARMEFLEENKKLLAEAQQRVATLEAEGRSKGYR